jgi:hypothetical protein
MSLTRFRFGFLVGLLLTVGWLLGHEGHAPLPTQGIRIDLKKGELLLSGSPMSENEPWNDAWVHEQADSPRPEKFTPSCTFPPPDRDMRKSHHAGDPN